MTAVDDLSFEVPEGVIMGFLGPNGAGKTTSLRLVLDIVRPSAGRIEVLGRAPGQGARREVGFLPEERGLYRRMTARDSVIYFARLKGIRGAEARRAADRLLERVGLGGVGGRRIDALSKGMAQKVQLAAALVNAPRLVLLDEPFSGLDPVNQAVLEDIVLDLARNGSTVVFSTHVMQHAERLCHRLVLIASGRKLFDGTQDEARRQLPGRLQLTARGDPSGLPGVLRAEAEGGIGEWSDWQVTLAPGADPGDLLEACFARGLIVRRFEPHRPSLHDVFVHLVNPGGNGSGR
ncbi:MAG TPA: ATP-binding cassette domain-containing protein [Stellaceae bacterium]|nr:ATP-binding cassette domain-containing protein [Stellaceae bacterium]